MQSLMQLFIQWPLNTDAPLPGALHVDEAMCLPFLRMCQAFFFAAAQTSDAFTICCFNLLQRVTLRSAAGLHPPSCLQRFLGPTSCHFNRSC